MAVVLPPMSDYYSAPYGAFASGYGSGHNLGYFSGGPQWGPRGGVSKRGHRGPGQGPRSYHGGYPAISALRAQNSRQARKHYKGKSRRHRLSRRGIHKRPAIQCGLDVSLCHDAWLGSYGQTPRSVPPAPDNTSSFLLQGGCWIPVRMCMMPADPAHPASARPSATSPRLVDTNTLLL